MACVDELKAFILGKTSLDELFMSFPPTFTLFKLLAVAIWFVSHEFITSGPKHLRLILSKHCHGLVLPSTGKNIGRSSGWCSKVEKMCVLQDIYLTSLNEYMLYLWFREHTLHSLRKHVEFAHKL